MVNAIKKIVEAIIMILVVFILFINISNFIQIKILHKKIATFNGYAFLEVASGSMEPSISMGDLVIINTKDKDILVNDVVTYISNDNSFVTHRVSDLKEDGFITKGDANNSIDEEIIEEQNIMGKYVFKISNFGTIIHSLQNPFTLILILVIGIIICILASTDKDGFVKDISDEEREFLEYKEKKLFIEKYKDRLKVGD